MSLACPAGGCCKYHTMAFPRHRQKRRAGSRDFTVCSAFAAWLAHSSLVRVFLSSVCLILLPMQTSRGKEIPLCLFPSSVSMAFTEAVPYRFIPSFVSHCSYERQKLFELRTLRLFFWIGDCALNPEGLCWSGVALVKAVVGDCDSDNRFLLVSYASYAAEDRLAIMHKGGDWETLYIIATVTDMDTTAILHPLWSL